jgi:hypothetical protein
VAVQRANAAMKEKLIEKQRKEKLEQVENAIGFSKVLRKITESVIFLISFKIFKFCSRLRLSIIIF